MKTKKVALSIAMAFCFTMTGCSDAGDAVEAYKKLKEANQEIQELKNEIKAMKSELEKYKSASKTMYD